MSPEAIVREFQSEAEAALAAAALRANGIHVEMRSAGMDFFHTSMAGRTVVVARAEDVARARQLLDTPARS
ncbi:MAG: putative signal transducing protein [Gemmatimonadaceae bacterium]